MISINLIPDTVRLAQARRRRLIGWSVSVAAAGALLAVAFGYDALERAKAARLHTENDQLQAELESMRAGLRDVIVQVEQGRIRLDRADALRSKRAWSAMFATIGRCMPVGCWLTSIATDPPKPSQGSTRAGRTRAGHTPQDGKVNVVIDAPRMLRILGYAAGAAEPHAFVAGLKQTEVFADVFLVHSRSEPVLDGTYFQFEIVCEW